jgi:hypothetical protein
MVGHSCYIGEFDNVNIGREMIIGPLERRLGGSNDTTQAICSTMMCYFRCLDDNLDLDQDLGVSRSR